MANQIPSVIAAFPNPKSLNFSFKREWSSAETGFFGPLVDVFKNADFGSIAGWQSAAKQLGTGGTWDSFKASVGQALAGSSLEAAVQSQYGFGINKRNAAIFQDIPFRDVQLQWSLRPLNKAQAKQFEKGIQILKVHSAPVLKSGDAIWDISGCKFTLTIDTGIDVGGTKILFQSEEMVVTDIQVDYTPNGFWSQHEDGWPTQVDLNVSFMETQLAFREGDKLVNINRQEVI